MDVLPCKGVESTTSRIHGSSFICGINGWTADEKYFPAQEQFGSACGVVRCGRKIILRKFQNEFRFCPSILLYIEGENLSAAAIAHIKPNQKGGKPRNVTIINQQNKIEEGSQHHADHCNQCGRDAGR